MSRRAALGATAAIVAIGVAGCGGGSSYSSAGGAAAKAPPAKTPEVSPAGDIPDNQAYVPYALSGAGVSVKVPEGWSRASSGGAVTFTDKLNAIRMETVAAHAPLTVREARQTEVPKLASSIKGFGNSTVSAVTRKAGTAVRITYLAAATPNAVTGKAGQNAVERYVFFRKGRDLVLTLTGPKGADNVDPWKIVTDSVAWSR